MRWVIIFSLGFIFTNNLSSQYTWDWRDPNDLNFVDFGDNKVILYNLLGTGLVHLLDQSGDSTSQVLNEFSVSFIDEYERDPLSNVYLAEFRRNFPIRSYFSIGGGLRYYWTQTSAENIHGFGVHAWFKWLIINNERFRLSYDNGVGPNYFLSAFPKGGTRFNFSTTYAISIDFKVAEKWVVMKFLNLHISNADIRRRERNPALDGIGIQLGIEY